MIASRIVPASGPAGFEGLTLAGWDWRLRRDRALLAFAARCAGPAAGAAAAREAGGGRAAADYLGNEVITVDEGERMVRGKALELGGVGCRCRFCENCCRGRGVPVRQALFDVVRQWSRFAMITFTCARERWAAGGPEAAFDEVRERRCISETMRTLARKGLVEPDCYFVAFECQGDGWPHWHVLCQPLPGVRVQRLWAVAAVRWETFSGERRGRAFRLKGNKPTFGDVHVQDEWSPKQQRRFSPMQAAGYVAKYVTKYPVKGWPQWVLNRERVRLFETSRGFWAKHGVPSPSVRVKASRHGRSDAGEDDRVCFCGTVDCPIRDQQTVTSGLQRVRGTPRTIGERVRRCCQTTSIVSRTDWELPDGTVGCKREFLGVVESPASVVLSDLIAGGVVDGGDVSCGAGGDVLVTSRGIFLRDDAALRAGIERVVDVWKVGRGGERRLCGPPGRDGVERRPRV